MEQDYTISNPRSGWEIALDRHLQALSSDQRRIFSESVTVDDVVLIVENSQKKSKEKRCHKILDALHKCAAPLQEFQAVIDVLAQSRAEIGYGNKISFAHT